MEDSEQSRIDKLKQALYSRKVKIKSNFVLDLNKHNLEVKKNWENNKDETPVVELVGTESDDGSKTTKKIFWFALVFFVLSAIFASYVYFRGSNVISANNIKIDVIGPTSIKAGEETLLDISITNNNDTTLKIADLVLEYPEGTRSGIDSAASMTHARIAFGDIAPGETVRRNIKAVMFGEENTIAHIDMLLEYRVSTSMSVFTKDTSYEVVIGSSPITISVTGLKEVNANQNYEVKVEVVSNSSEVVKDVLLVGELPFGFEITSITPEPIQKSTIWNLGDIEPNGKREIVIKGKMYGDHNEERYFKFNTGTKDEKIATKIDGIIASVTNSVIIREPFIGIGLHFEKASIKTENYIAKSDSTITGIIEMTNNLGVPISDVVIEAKIDGKVVSREGIKPAQGFYDSNTDLLKWNKFYVKDLESVLPKSKDSVIFTFDTLKSSEISALKISNPVFVIDITVRGKRRLESGVPEEIISTIKRTVKMQTDSHFTSGATHGIGPIENEGEIPPKVGAKTEYTINWAITNTFNELDNATVKAVLPEYINWTGIVVGDGEKITYNKDSREIIWDLGKVSQRSDGKITLRQVSFQVAITPSISQYLSVPVLLEVANFTARDTFTNTNIGEAFDQLTTALPSDPGFEFSDAQVIK